MTTEPDSSISLKQYVDLSVERALDALAAFQTQMELLQQAHTEAHTREHEMADLAIRKAEEAMTQRLAQMNEFRQQISDERASYLTKAEFEQSMTAVRVWQEATDKQLDKINENWANLQGRMVGYGGIVALASLIATFIAIWAAME